MDESVSTPVRRPVRRRKTKMQIFKEVYLPYLILFIAAIVIIIFIIGASVRNAAEKKADTASFSVTQTLEC